MRFDDSLKTILSADMQAGLGAQSAWRQLVDLMSRDRIPADEPTLARLRMLRQAVPVEVRAASARAVAFATPGTALVGLFAEDTLPVAAPVLRTAILPAADWLAMLARLSPEGRSILRHRRDLPGDVRRGLESFGSTDFVLGDDTAPIVEPPTVGETGVDAPTVDIEPASPTPPPADTPLSATPFVALGDVARGLPVIAEARRHEEAAKGEGATSTDTGGGYRIADLVARIDAFQKRREVAPEPMRAPEPATAFRYETDRQGAIRWVGGVSRGALIGVSFAHATTQGVVGVDAVFAGALRQRARFAGARLDVGGASDAAGSWRVSGEPLFDHATGRFQGFRGTARRARLDEAAVRGPRDDTRADSLRQLVHELRTPTNAIAGFAELIETQLLGPVAPSYRDHATVIREQAAALIAAIDDLDTAARIEGDALEQRPQRVALDALVTGIARDLAPLAAMRGATLAADIVSGAAATVDDRLVDRLVSRWLGAIVSAAWQGERIAVTVRPAGDAVSIEVTRPAAFGDRDTEALLRIDADAAGEAAASLLGVGFALRLSRNLARELGGELVFATDRLTLRLPAAVDAEVGQAIN